MTQPLTVYFDGACPLCQREIAFYRRRRGADAIRWVDLTDGDDPGPDLTCAAALERFHVRLPDGALRHGAAGFAALLKELPSLRWLGHILDAPGLAWIAERTYRAFAQNPPIPAARRPAGALKKRRRQRPCGRKDRWQFSFVLSREHVFRSGVTQLSQN